MVIDNKKERKINLKLFPIVFFVVYTFLIFGDYFIISSPELIFEIWVLTPSMGLLVALLPNLFFWILGRPSKEDKFLIVKRESKLHKSQVILRRSILFLAIVVVGCSFLPLENPYNITSYFVPDLSESIKARDARSEAYTYGVKTDLGEILQVPMMGQSINSHKVSDCSLYLTIIDLLDSRKTSKKVVFQWGSDNMESFMTGDGYFIRNLTTGKNIELHLDKNYPYINSISLLPIENKGEYYLFVLSNLRATTQKSLLNVYKYPGDLVFEELFSRGRAESILGQGYLTNGDKIITLSLYLDKTNVPGKYIGPCYDSKNLDSINVKDSLILDHLYKFKF